MNYIGLVIGAAILSINVFVALPAEVQAQAGRTTTAVCQDDITGAIYFQPSSGICPPGYTERSVPGRFSQLCVTGTAGNFNVAAPVSSGDASGTLTCTEGTLQAIRSAQTTTPPTQQPPTQTPPTTTTPTTTTPTTKTPTTTTPNTPGDPGNCGEGFTAKGPLCIPNNPFGGSPGVGSCNTLGCIASKIISYLLLAAGIVAVIFVIIGGYYYMTARGNDAQALSGRKTLVNALIGLVIVILSFLIVQVATNFITG